MPRRQPIDPENMDFQVIGEVAALIQQGGLVILPTDTAYGLTGNPSSASVVQRVIQVKQRAEGLGMPLLAANLAQIRGLVTLSPAVEAFVTKIWPGAVTIIAPACQEFPPGIKGPDNTLAVRIPNHPVTLEVIQATGYPIIGTSANKSEGLSPRTAENAATQIGDEVDYILDAGPTYQSADSTIVNFTVDPPKIIREGVLTGSEIARILTNTNK